MDFLYHYNDTSILLHDIISGEESIPFQEDTILNSTARYLSSSTYYYYFPWQNQTTALDFDSSLTPQEDVTVDAVVSSLYFNSIVFICLMGSYELLRRLLPAVYSSRQRTLNTRGGWRKRRHNQNNNNNNKHAAGAAAAAGGSSSSFEDDDEEIDQGMAYLAEEDQDDTDVDDLFPYLRHNNSLGSLPDKRPLDWIGPVFGIPWKKVRSKAGLDGYFFLRYIRMCVRITAVSIFWALLILVTCYGTGDSQEGAQGWYHISIVNISTDSWRMWVPPIFAIFFSGFTFFVLKQEYKHFLNQRMDFLAKGDTNVHPQHHYSLMVESIPHELRSDKAMFDYFDKLFPGKVHSCSVVLNLPDLEAVSSRSRRVCERLEKSIAYYEAYGTRPTHYVGVPRLNFLGLQSPPLSCFCCTKSAEVLRFDGEDIQSLQRPQRGAHVDSITYYVQDMAATSRALMKMQKRKSRLARSGNRRNRQDTWIEKTKSIVSKYAQQIMEDSEQDNDLIESDQIMMMYGQRRSSAVPQVENMRSLYGSFGYQSGYVETAPVGDHCNVQWNVREDADRRSQLLPNVDATVENFVSVFVKRYCISIIVVEGTHPLFLCTLSVIGRLQYQQQSPEGNTPLRRLSTLEDNYMAAPGAADRRVWIRKLLGRFGLDFVVSGLAFLNRQLDVTLEGVVGTTMSSTGFVTFLDLTTVTCAVSTPLTHKPNMLDMSVAPDPKEIWWENAHAPKRDCQRRESFVNVLLFLGVILWSFPLAAIQAFAKAKYVAQIPGMEWILTFQGGAFTAFVNGYLPVLALLGIILILPVIFQVIAIKYERRKTFSDVQGSLLGRYFYYQLANVYITATAGSLWKSLADIIDHPGNVLQLLGESLPTMVGYFVALLVTKILAGLPMIFLRFGALSRMLLLKAISAEKKLTQRELDAIYRQENVQYGWEFPSQLLVIVIVFTYAVICPVILPVGMLYFLGSLIVYKKQVLYVYTPIYESGGALFSKAVQHTLFGLVCGQLTLIGYLITRGCRYQALVLLPLPLCTVYGMRYFKKHYAEPSKLLSMERAREYDRVADELDDPSTPLGRGLDIGNLMGSPRNGIESRRRNFDKDSYRQPVLTEQIIEPLPYRRGKTDEMTVQACELLARIRRLADEHAAKMGNNEDAAVSENGSNGPEGPDNNLIV